MASSNPHQRVKASAAVKTTRKLAAAAEPPKRDASGRFAPAKRPRKAAA
jgi:hypothetical protein